ncbi:MAG TPA: TrkA family potassium uptake protein [Chloroflexota bacterium]|nr:TrkA family potassium uptake protein [Chloroflexota bacterium]
MYVVVVGGGKVGYYLTKSLLAEGYEVVLTEKEKSRANELAEELGESVAVRGDGCEASFLNEIGTKRADVFVAVTGDDEDNLVSCQMAKVKFQVPRTIARVNNPKNQAIFERLGIDVTVSATNILLALIEQEIPRHAMVNLISLKQAGMEIVEVEIPDHSPVVGKRLRDVGLDRDMHISVILRGQEAVTPSADTDLLRGDKVYALIREAKENEFRALLVGDAVPVGIR